MSSKRSLSQLIDAARASGRDLLLEHEAGAILSALGIRAPQQIVCEADEAATAAAYACEHFPGTRVVVKAASTTILHKTELGGVRFVDRDPQAIRDAIAAMESSLACGQYSISEFVEHDLAPGAELLLGIRWTGDFGPVVSLAAGGVATEFLAANIRPGREIAIASPGLVEDAGRFIDGLAITPLITGGVRKQRARASRSALCDLIARCLEFAAEHVPDLISEIEVNPLVPTADGFYALDAIVRIGSPVEAGPERPIEKIEHLLAPRSVAVIGVSRNLNAGHVIVNNLIKEGVPRERIFVIKPGEEEIEGCHCVVDIASLPEKVDLLVLAIPAEQAPQAIDDAIDGRKAESIILIPGGLGEHEGSENLEHRVRESLARSRSTSWRGPVVNGANCVGIQSRGKVNTIFLPDRKIEHHGSVAPLAVVSQSGALAVVLATKLGAVAPKHVISIGNQIDLTVGDYMQFFEQSKDVDVLAFYVEGFQPLDGRRWLDAARRAVAAGKTVILYRAGRTAAGSKATQSHTAAVAGEYVVTRQLATASGVLVAESLDEFTDLVRMSTLLRDRTAAGKRVVAMSNAGFESVGMADHGEAFTIADLSAATRERIAGIIAASRLDRIVTISNPLDVNPMLGDEAFARVAAELINDPAADAGIIGCVPLTAALGTLPDEITAGGSIVARLGDLWRATTKPWICIVDAGPNYDAMAALLEQQGIPTFRTADRGIRALGKWVTARLVADSEPAVQFQSAPAPVN